MGENEEKNHKTETERDVWEVEKERYEVNLYYTKCMQFKRCHSSSSDKDSTKNEKK